MSRHLAIVVCIVLVVLSVGAAVYYYGRLPDTMPTHWDINGRANGYMPKFWGVVVWPGIIAVLGTMLFALPSMSPNNFRLGDSVGTFNVLVVAICIFMFVVGVTAMHVAAGSPLPVQNLIPGMVGALWVVIGNYMGKLRKNFFAGIRTPWTLASDEVWSQTHRLGGWVFVLGGLAIVAESATGLGGPGFEIGVFITATAVMMVVPVVYSFYLYKRIES